jgi:uncharacterized protein (DUF2267 family)
MSNQTITSDAFYRTIMQDGNLRTPDHASRLTFAVLHTLGFNLSGATKRKLAKALPDEAARYLTRGWRLINVRRSNLPLADFAKDVARHSGNTDPQYAARASQVVFRQVKKLIDDDVARAVARDLSPEVRDLWNAA